MSEKARSPAPAKVLWCWVRVTYQPPHLVTSYLVQVLHHGAGVREAAEMGRMPSRGRCRKTKEFGELSMEKGGFERAGLRAHFLSDTGAPLSPWTLDKGIVYSPSGRQGAVVPNWKGLPASHPWHNGGVCLGETLSILLLGFPGHENLQSWKRNQKARPFLAGCYRETTPSVGLALF